MNVIVIFTYGISLKDWHEAGILDREIKFYKKMSNKYNINYSFITFGTKDDEMYVQDLEEINVYPVYEFIKFSNNKFLNLFKSLLIPFKLKNLLTENQIVKTNQLNGAWIGIILKKLLKIPLFTRTGYNLYEFSINNKKPFLVKLFHYLLTQIALFSSDLYTVTSIADKSFLQGKFNKTKAIKIIPNWIEKLSHNNFSNRYENKILTVGRLEKQKNIDGLIKLMEGSRIEIDIVGEGSEKNSLMKLSEKLNVKINFKGKLNFHDLNNIYKDYRIFILPSLFEGNPKALLEAMGSGCLVIAANNKNIQEIIRNNENGILFNPEDNLKQIIEYFLNNTEESEKIIQKSYQSIEDNNLIENIMESEIYYYKNLIK